MYDPGVGRERHQLGREAEQNLEMDWDVAELTGEDEEG